MVEDGDDGAAAVFFDLDRTLLRGASGPIIGEALKAAGLLPSRNIPGEGLVYRLYELFGESWPNMMLTRQAARFASGWDQTAVQAAGKEAAERLVGAVQPFARPIIEEHHGAGRRVVLATTTPYDLVKPLADSLGLDDVVATRYGVVDGRYSGAIDGDFVWGQGKLRSVRRWAEDNGASLRRSWAYSDSFYDAPLLSAVGHPVAVNPDPRLQLLATIRRWPVLHLDVPAGIPKLLGVEPQQALMAIIRPELVPYARFDISGAERIPETGPALLVANHRSYFDPIAIGLALGKRGRPVRFLAKRELFDAPVIGWMVRALGGIKVDRGSGSKEPLAAAAAALAAGELVALMPQGTIPRGEAFFDPELKGKHGAARLARLAKVPVIPIGLWGTERVWPRRSRLPNVLNVTNPPLVTVRVGEPIELRYRSIDADTRRIMAAIVELLPPEAREHRQPTEEELARTMPP